MYFNYLPSSIRPSTSARHGQSTAVAVNIYRNEYTFTYYLYIHILQLLIMIHSPARTQR